MFDSIRKYGRFAQPFGTGEWYPVNADGSTSRVLELAKKGSIEVPDYSRFSVLDNPQNDEGTILMPMNAVTPRCWRRRGQGLLKCAFGYVATYDAEIQMTSSDTSKAESGRRYQLRALGKTKAERDAMSPVNHADKIRIPVYLAAGARDPRCPPENTEAMEKALIAAGNTPEGVMITSGEMHGFYKDENKLKLYTEMLNFFARHIGGKPAGAGGGAKASR